MTALLECTDLLLQDAKCQEKGVRDITSCYLSPLAVLVAEILFMLLFCLLYSGLNIDEYEAY